MKSLLEVIKTRTVELQKSSSSAFNTNDFIVDLLLDNKMERRDVIDHIIAKRIELTGKDIDKMKSEDIDALVGKLYKTSKNGLDTSVSDSQNNSSFSYNQKYADYKLNKVGSTLEIVKVKK